MPDPEQYHFKLPPYAGPPLPPPSMRMYPGVEPHVPSCTSDRTINSDGRIRAIVIHATAGSSSSGAMSVLFEHKASWHFLVPDENEPQHGQSIWACAPPERAAWHVRNERSHPDVNNGSRFVNYWSIGVEIVNAQGSGDPFSDWQVEQAAALVRWAWSRHPELVDVVSHAKLDPDRRSDPGERFPWSRFRELVVAEVSTGHGGGGAVQPIEVIGPDGGRIACDPRLLDGVTVGEIRPLVEALGFTVEYSDPPEMRMMIRRTGGS